MHLESPASRISSPIARHEFSITWIQSGFTYCNLEKKIKSKIWRIRFRDKSLLVGVFKRLIWSH